MFGRKSVKRNLKKIQRIHTWQLLVLFVLSSILSASFLRLNNIGMVQRRAAVISADKSGDSAALQNRLIELQRYVTSHMNTDMGKGVFLENTYQTAVNDAYEKAANSEDSNNIYKTVQDICAPKFTSWSIAYVNCVSNELAKYPAGSNLASVVQKPSYNAYVHNYISPIWSPDFAGFLVLISVVILIMIIIRITSVLILKLMLKIKFRRI